MSPEKHPARIITLFAFALTAVLAIIAGASTALAILSTAQAMP